MVMLGLSLTSLVLLSVWFFADKPCVTHNHYGMRAVAVGLLPLRHVHQVHWVHQVHLAKCFVTKPAFEFLLAETIPNIWNAGVWNV